MMPSFFCVSNLTSQAVVPCLPYEFKPTTEISVEVRTNKKARQEWYKNPATVHQFYSGVEAANPNGRVSKANPPRKLHAIVCDYDMPLTTERIAEAINAMKLKPAWVERSLGGNCRLIWILSRPILADTLDFSTFILQQARTWLSMDLLPGLDAKALEDATRLYCNGCEWVATGAGPISEIAVQAFFVDCGQKYLFKDCGSDVEIPLDICEKKLRERYPAFNWPGSFENGSSGPSFWVEGSTSVNSAICKKFGMFSFAAHAAKPFYSWSDLLGADFAVEFRTNCLATATAEKYWDGKSYWYMNEAEGRFVSASREVLVNHLQVRCRVSRKPDKSGSSMMDRCLEHIHTFGHCDGGAPILFSPPGLTLYNGIKLVNSSPKSKIILPSGVDSVWGKTGNFPFISAVLTALFDPVEPQLEYFLAWLRYFYVTAWKQQPAPGQNIFLAGVAGCGKCVGRDVPILLHSGDIKLSQEIQVGDVLMGDDGTPRNVLQANQGFGKMYRIIPNKGIEWTCNGEHILVLKGSNKNCAEKQTEFAFLKSDKGKWNVKRGEECEVSVNEYLQWRETEKHLWKLFCSSGWERPEVVLPFDPYIYGLWLGDGCKTHGCLTSADAELGKIWTDYFLEQNFSVLDTPEKSKARRYAVSRKESSPRINHWRDFIRKTSSKNNEKFILPEYINSSRRQRLELLAGLLDTDGSLTRGGFDFVQKNKDIADKTALLARSLGFRVHMAIAKKSCQTGAVGDYYRLTISGDCSLIPTRLARKKCGPRKQKKNVLVSGFTIEPLPENEYYGVVIDGNRRFLLGDGTVTHNTLTNREIVGGLMGGFVDASRYLVGDVSFNSSLFVSAVWSVDDSQISDSETARRKFSSCIKACAANADWEYRRKFENSVMVPFMGRVICTLNLDASSTRSLPILDESLMQKVSFFRCASVNRFVFPDREIIKGFLKSELPHFAQFLVDSKTPDELLGESRFGVKAYHAPELTAKSHQATRSAPFSEILVEMLTRWFSDNPDATEFRASCTQIMRLLYADPLNSEVLRTVKIESVNRYCEEISRQGVVACTSETGPRKTRLWIFPRFQ